MTAQIKVGVVGQVEDGRPVRGCRVIEVQLVTGEGIAHVGGQGAGVALVTVRADEGELDAVRDLLCGPVMDVKALGAAMERVGTVVDWQMILLAVERKGTLSDAVAVAPDNRAHVG